jgi:glycosyltransferase involved in cell wall biosynthesis
MPLAAYEAAACGLPVIGTRVNGVDGLISPGAGIAIERTPAALGAALARLAEGPALCRRLGSEERRRAQSFTWQSSVDSVMQVYTRLSDRAR